MNDKIQQTKETYDKIAEQFAQTRKYIWADIKPLIVYTSEGDKVLDLGCGTGRLYQLFQDIQVDYVGIDQNETMIKVAQQANPKAKYLVGDMLDLPFEDNEFDVIYCIATFHHLPDEKLRLQALAEMKRVLKPGGKVIMTNWDLEADWAQTKVKKGKYVDLGEGDYIVPWMNSEREVLGERYYHAFTQDELENLLKLAKFELEEQYLSDKQTWSDNKRGGNIITVFSLE